MTDAIRQQILASPHLPTLPAVALQVLDLTQRAEVDVAQIAAVVTRDPALSARILKTINSSFYARRNPVGTIGQAIVMLGLQTVKTLVLGFSLVPTLVAKASVGFDRDAYWRRSLHAATSARALAARAGMAAQQEEAFLAALLADVGVLVLDQTFGPAYHAAHVAATSHVELADRERSAIGATHAEVAEMLAAAWRLPPILAEPMAFHHEPSRCSSPALATMATLVGLAGRIGDVFVDAASEPAVRDVRDGCERSLRLSAADADAVIADVARSTAEVATLFDVRIGDRADVASILRRANDALVELSLRSIERAAMLTRANEALQRRANADRLTGLANRLRFDEFVADAFVGPTPLSMLMIDVDHFKTINDRYGHDAGDAVLAHLGGLLRDVARSVDLAARYGGEEFALVMPGTTRAEAMRAAERLRQDVERQPATCGAHRVAATISIGVATHESAAPFADAAQLVKAADLVMYKAKHSGRNNVQVFLPTVAVRAA